MENQRASFVKKIETNMKNIGGDLEEFPPPAHDCFLIEFSKEIFYTHPINVV